MHWLIGLGVRVKVDAFVSYRTQRPSTIASNTWHQVRRKVHRQRTCLLKLLYVHPCHWGGAAYSFVVCLSRLAIDHASLSRQSTVPAPNRDTSKIWALFIFFPYITWKAFCYLISPSCSAACGHHLSPRIGIVFSLLSLLVHHVTFVYVMGGDK